METQRTRPMYKAFCTTARESEKGEIFPNYFSFPPQRGDFVRSQNGVIYKIISIMHTAKITSGKYGEIQTPQAVLGLEKV